MPLWRMLGWISCYVRNNKRPRQSASSGVPRKRPSTINARQFLNAAGVVDRLVRFSIQCTLNGILRRAAESSSSNNEARSNNNVGGYSSSSSSRNSRQVPPRVVLTRVVHKLMMMMKKTTMMMISTRGTRVSWFELKTRQQLMTSK